MAPYLGDDAFAALLEGCKKAVDEIVTGKSDLATQRLAVKQLLDRLDYRPALGKEGTMEDLRSHERLSLILNMNSGIVQGYRQWLEDQSVAIAFPANELIRLGYRKIQRPWIQIWNETRSTLAQTTAMHAASTGRMIAMKDDPIWVAISDFGLPWSPYKYGSGMGTVGVGYTECLDLGLIREGEQGSPHPDMHPDFEAILISALTVSETEI